MHSFGNSASRSANAAFHFSICAPSSGTPDQQCNPHHQAAILGSKSDASVEISAHLREWDYGDYGGITVEELHKMPAQNHANNSRPRDIFVDGFEGGDLIIQLLFINY